MEKILIGFADDQRLFRQSLATVIRAVPDFDLLMEAENGLDCLRQFESGTQVPEILLMDMEMPGMDGIELNERIHKDYPGVKVIVLSVYNRERLISSMISAGACGYLEKNCDTEELILAIRTVHNRGFYMNTSVLKAIQKNSSQTKHRREKSESDVALTAREKEVLRLICKENSNAEIADSLFISVRTAEGHRNNLLMKTGCRNTAGLVLFAVKQGIYDLVF